METYNGHVRTPQDAIILFEACRLGLLPRVQRRLSEKERQQIKSGSVFVWDEREAGMRRWTDGKSWSASRVSGSFLTYREMEGKRGGNGLALGSRKSNGKSGETPKSCDSDMDGGEDGPDGYRYKPDGLMKSSFSITTSSGQHLHLISYYARSHPTAQTLNQPSTDPSLRHIRPQKGMYPESTVSEPQTMPPINRSPMGTPYMGSPQAVGASSPYTRPTTAHHYGYITPATQAWPSASLNGGPSHHSPYYPSGAAPPTPLTQSGQSRSGLSLKQPVSPTNFDRAPPSLSNNELPPPPPYHSQNGHQPPAAMPQYVPHLSPRVAQAAELAQQQAQAALQTSAEYMRAGHLASATSNRHPTPIQEYRQASGLTQVTGDGQLPSPVSPAPSASGQVAHPGAPSESLTIPEPAISLNAQAKIIPSIGALINVKPSDVASVEVKSDRTASRPGSRSPASKAQLSTQEVSKEKLSFTEDMRALRQLDTAFSVK